MYSLLMLYKHLEKRCDNDGEAYIKQSKLVAVGCEHNWPRSKGDSTATKSDTAISTLTKQYARVSCF